MKKFKSIALTAVLGALVVACSGGSNGGGDLVAGGPNPPGGNNPPPTGPGGGAGLDGGISGSGRVLGTLDAFGSIILNDLELTTDRAEILVEGEPALESDLRVGYVLDVGAELDDGEALSVHYRSAIVGPITSITVIDVDVGRADLVVLGQTVRVNSATVYDGTRFAALVIDAVVEVSGLPDADGRLVASYLGAAVVNEYKVVGEAVVVDDDTFQIGGLTVDAADADLQNFGGAMLANGDVVEVRGEAADFTAPDRLEADEVERLGEVRIEEGTAVKLEGFIDRFVDVSDFDVAGRRVTTNGITEFEDGTPADLGLNVKVEVVGTIDGEGTVVATEVEIETVSAVRVEGLVEATDPAAGTLRVLGVTLTVTEATELEDDDGDSDSLTVADLNPGDFVEARGIWDGATVILRELERDEAEDEARLRGPVTRIDAAAFELDIAMATITTDSGTEYEGLDDVDTDRDAFFAALMLGMPVDARWEPFVEATAPVDKLSLEEDDD